MENNFDESPMLIHAIHEKFKPYAGQTLYLTAGTAGTDIWESFIANVPSHLRSVYTCNCCKRFIQNFGTLAAIDNHGRLHSVLWPSEYGPHKDFCGFGTAFRLLATEVQLSQPSDVLVSTDRILGTPASPPDKNGKIWTHFNVDIQQAYVPRGGLTADQRRALYKEEYGMLARSVVDFPLSLVQKTQELLLSGHLYRSEKCLAISIWFRDLLDSLRSRTTEQRCALIWKAAVSAPTGFTHVRSGMLGTLLTDMQSGMDLNRVISRFNEKMAPDQYMRAQVAPKAGNIAAAEKVVQEHKASGALSRRYARLADLEGHMLFRPQAVKVPSREGVFGHLTPKTKVTPTPEMNLPCQTMTWEKFARTVLPDAVSIEAQVPETSDRFAALVTAATPEAPPILQWDAEDNRNPVSWYYHAGIDGEMKRRVIAAGGQYADVDIRASLLWNNRNDLDLYVITPSREMIYYNNKKSHCGGWLDVDMNVSGETTEPVENIRWKKGTARTGRYQVVVQNFRFHERVQSPTPFQVEVEIAGQIYHFSGVASPNRQTGSGSDILVFTFDYVAGRGLTGTIPTHNHNIQVGQSTNQWSVTNNAWVKVTGIVPSPNLWGKQLVQHGKHMFFLLEGCKDKSEGLGRGFFTETLRSEFHSIRATLEAFTQSAVIADAEEAEACGLGMTDQKPWNLKLRVTTANSVSTYLIDRWD